MKQITIFMILFFLICGQSFGQLQKGSMEISTSPSLYIVKDKEDDESETVLNFPVRFGYYLSKNIEIEPELTVTMPEETEDTGFLFLGNVLYNFQTDGNTVPFILLGAGYGNSMKLFSFTLDQEMGITAINFGAGLKFFLNKHVAFRTEYRFIKYSGEKTENEFNWSYTRKIDTTIHKLLFGFSVFLINSNYSAQEFDKTIFGTK